MNRQVNMLVDTGSAVSVVPLTMLPILQPLLSSCSLKLSDAQGNAITAHGQCQCHITIPQLRREFSVSLVVAQVTEPILGANFLSQNNLLVNVRQRLLIDAVTNLQQLGTAADSKNSIKVVSVENFPFTNEFSELFEAPNFFCSSHKVSHRIITKTGNPVSAKARQLSKPKLDCAKAAFDAMLETGIIRRSDSPWSSALHMVPKKSNEWRPCGDYRALNKITVADSYPIPNIQSFTANLEGCAVFSKIDLVKAYHQIPLHQDSVAKTAIVTPFGLFEFLRMPFGLRNSSATFQRFIDAVTSGLTGVYAFVDDILVSGRTQDEHDASLRALFVRLREHGMRIAPEKCEFSKSNMTFLGHHVSAAGIRPSEEKLSALMEMPIPKNFKELRSVLGMFGFYQRFIPGYAKIAAPLRVVNETFEWTDECLSAFKTLQQSLASAITLEFPSSRVSRFTITTDASNFAIGGCLHQIVDGDSQPLEFYSRKLSATEAKYSTFDKELLALVAAIKKWKHIIEGSETVAFTDHKPLLGAFRSNTERMSSRQQRHLQLLSEYLSDVIHIAGADNIVADTLSRVNNVSSVVIDSFDLTSLAKAQSEELKSQFHSPLVGHELPSGAMLWCDNQNDILRPIVPESHRRTIFDELHGLSHPGVRGTLKLIQQRFVWPQMARDIKQMCRTCEKCQQCKVHRHTKSSAQKFVEPTDRFQCVHMDIVGPLQPTSEGYAYLVTFIDRSTRWLEAVPLKSISAEEVAQAFLNGWVSRFGVPLHLITDRGSQFESRLFSELSKTLGFHRLRCSAYHPQSNGLLERIHRTLKNGLKCRIKSRMDWLIALPVVLLSLRILPTHQNDLSPFTLVTGANVQIPTASFQDVRDLSLPYMQDLSNILRDFSVTPRSVAPNMNTHTPAELDHCDRVWVRVDRVKKPLEAPYQGPFRVLKRGAKTFAIERLNGSSDTVSIDRLKPYRAPLSLDKPNISESQPMVNSKEINLRSRTVTFSDI
jgi:transposase InsO family protein